MASYSPRNVNRKGSEESKERLFLVKRLLYFFAIFASLREAALVLFRNQRN
jgi:hypothetical protein